MNVIVAGKQPAPQWLDDRRRRAALRRRHRHLGVGQQRLRRRARRRDGGAGDVPTLEVLAAVTMLRELCRSCKIRVINVVDLMKLQPATEHPHGLSDQDFDALFTADKPIIFAYHGYPVADSPADLPPHQPSQSARSRLQGGRHDHHAVRHDGAERSGSLSPGRGCDRSVARAGSGVAAT